MSEDLDMKKLNALSDRFTLALLGILMLSCGKLDDLPFDPCTDEGSLNCPCVGNRACDQLPDRTQLVCVSDVCVMPACEQNEQNPTGCVCSSTAECGEGLVCWNGACAEDRGQPLELPDTLECYTRCRGGEIVLPEGTVLTCNEQGLIPGCHLDGTQCVNGSCINIEEEQEILTMMMTMMETGGSQGPISCVNEADCPEDSYCSAMAICVQGCRNNQDCDGEFECQNGSCSPPGMVSDLAGKTCSTDCDCGEHQNCVQELCITTCPNGDECREGQLCISGACREECTGSDACRAGYICAPQSDNFDTQVCMPDSCIETQSGSTRSPSPNTSAAVLSQRVFNRRVDGLVYGKKPEGVAVSDTFNRISISPNAEYTSFVLENKASSSQTFVIEKGAHTSFTSDGPMVIEDNPLFWIRMATGPKRTSDQTEEEREQEVVNLEFSQSPRIELSLAANEQATIYLSDLVNTQLQRWEGQLNVVRVSQEEESRPVQYTIPLDYTGSAHGQWSGKLYSFATFNDQGLERWLNNPSRPNLQLLSNAFIKRWSAFKEQRISVGEFKAMLQATVTGSWKNPSVRSLCPSREAPDPNVACYLYDNPEGISVYSDFLPANPIPSGVLELPFFMSVRPQADDQSQWEGAIDTGVTMQYLGKPSIRLSFTSDPNDCSDAPIGSACIKQLDGFTFDSVVGGRFRTDYRDINCQENYGFKHTKQPWLIPGFTLGVSIEGDKQYVYECQDQVNPLGDIPELYALNANLAQANPVPDGQPKRRRVELVDGVMIDQATMYVIVKETYPSLFGIGDDFSNYGIIELTRSGAEEEEELYNGSSSGEMASVYVRSDVCDPDLVPGVPLNTENFGRNLGIWTLAMVDGYVPEEGEEDDFYLPPDEFVHYLCEDTGVFDGGGDLNQPLPCTGKAIFFTLSGESALNDNEIANLECQTEGECSDAANPLTCIERSISGAKVGTCAAQLDDWIADPEVSVRINPKYFCETRCDEDTGQCTTEEACSSGTEVDRRSGLTFLAADAPGAYYEPLRSLIAEAFRYKIKFSNRSGSSIGFSPSICIPNSELLPYCYEPEAIEKLYARIDCAAHIYTEYYDDLGEYQGKSLRRVLKDYLTLNFGYRDANIVTQAPKIDGFEFLNAELFIMLGDESFVNAYKSRFDLAGMNLATFEGSLFETGGIDLTGSAGFEMYSLYQATQYYQSVLDRFYSISGMIARSLDPEVIPSGEEFITPKTVTSYFTKLIKASSQKSRAWSQIAKKYQYFNEPDLARRVIERAYASAFIENLILSQLMQRAISNSINEAEINKNIELAQLTYSAALFDMKSVYQGISDEVTLFGFTADYIPFPALYPAEQNAFVKLLEMTRRKIQIAEEKERRALDDNRSFETDAASFQSELSQIKREYDNQLAQICGTFQGDDGNIYPAVQKYAQYSQATMILGDPCGLTGNGDIFEAVLNLEREEREKDLLNQRYQNIEDDIEDEYSKVKEQCARISDLRDFRLESENEIISLSAQLQAVRSGMNVLDRTMEGVKTFATFMKCSVIAGIAAGGDCPLAAGAAAKYAVGSALVNLAYVGAEASALYFERKIDTLQRDLALRDIQEQCTSLRIDSTYVVNDLMRRVVETGLEVARNTVEINRALAQLEEMINKAKMIQSQMSEAEEMTISVQAARNDPNVRIYRNDAVIAADRTFYEAIAYAYRLTKVYEYYTAQSYPELFKMPLIRMVSYGDFSLDEYLSDLEEAFYTFEETYGIPDSRVMVISLKDDIIKVPYTDGNGESRSVTQDSVSVADWLQSPSRLDENGYIVIPFSTSLKDLSPLTYNHKIEEIMINISGAGGDYRRAYLRQIGTGIMRNPDGEKVMLSLPTRTAVINTFDTSPNVPIVGSRDGEIFRSLRFRDYPLVNTSWELVLNLTDEQDNHGIDLSEINDIKMYIFYNDFTSL